jgi:hypothetical protein
MARLLSVALTLIMFVSPALAQDKNWKDDLTRALKEAYPNTKTATFERNNITEPGVVLVIQKPSIMGENVHNTIYRASTVENGVASGPKGMAGFFSSGSAKELAVGEKVYVRDIDVMDDAVRLQLLTLEMYDMVEKGSTKRVRLVTPLLFKFANNKLSSMTLDDVKKSIDVILMAGDLASAPKTVELGQTIEQVEGILGKPVNVVKLGSRVIYTYKDMKITFTDGKLSDVQ